MPGEVEQKRDLYRDMWRIRMVEEKIAELYPEQEMRCPVHLSIGQEACAVGVCAALKKEDAAMSGHRAHAHYLAKGGDLKKMLAEIYGRATGCCGGKGGSMHLIDLEANFLGSTPIVGGTIPVATGVAWAVKLKDEERVTVSFFGEGAVEEGVWHESVNFAALHKLPIIYVCENNFYSVYTHLKDRQPERKLTDLAAAHGLKIWLGDGNNVQEVWEIAQAARKWALKSGPVFVELATYRWREHCGPNYDNDIGYRTREEFLGWQKRDPLKEVDDFLEAEDKDKISREIDEAVEFAKASPWPETYGN